MWLHYCAFAALVLVAALSGGHHQRRARRSRATLVLSFLMFVAFASLRATTVGNDTIRYDRFFEEVALTDSFTEALTVSRYEQGYVALNYVVSRFTDDFNILLLIVAVFSFGSVALFIQRYARSTSLAVLLAFGMSVFYDVMLAIRQGIAVAIFLFAFSAIVDRKPLRYLVLVGLAAQFHSSAFILLVVYFISSLKVRTFGDGLKWGALVGVAMLSLNWLLSEVANVSTYYGQYLSSEYAEGGARMATVMAVAVRLILIALAATCGWSAAMAADDTAVTRNLLTLVVVDVAIVVVSLGFNLLDRFEMYFTLPFVVGLTNIVARDAGERDSYVPVPMVMAAFARMTVLLLFRPGWYTLFPYRTILEEGVS